MGIEKVYRYSGLDRFRIRQIDYKGIQKEKETHIHFEWHLYQRYIVCVNESVFEMLNIHIWTHCDAFHCKQTMCVSRVNGKSDSLRGNASELQAV